MTTQNDVASLLVDATRKCRMSDNGHSEARKTTFRGYKVDVAVKRLPDGDFRRTQRYRDLLFLFRVDREAARQAGIPDDNGTLDDVLNRLVMNIDDLFKSTEERGPVLPEDFDVSCDADVHFNQKRYRCSLWMAGPSLAGHFGPRPA